MLISTLTPFGSPFTATVSRAGWSPVKKDAYTSLTVAKCDISDKKIVVLATCEKFNPASCKMASRFFMTCSVSSAIVVASIFPFDGLMAIWPEINNRPLAITDWLYGPMGAGAFSVLMIFFDMISNLRKINAFAGPIFATGCKRLLFYISIQH